MSFNFFFKLSIYLTLFLSLQNCKEKVNHTDNKLYELISTEQDAKISKIVIPKFNKDVEIILLKWEDFPELLELITNLSDKKYQVLEASDETFTDLFSSLVNKVPEIINKSSIKARVTVIETLAYKLKSEYKLNNEKSAEFENTRVFLLNSFSNLIFQITKTSEKELQLITKSE